MPADEDEEDASTSDMAGDIPKFRTISYVVLVLVVEAYHSWQDGWDGKGCSSYRIFLVRAGPAPPRNPILYSCCYSDSRKIRG